MSAPAPSPALYSASAEPGSVSQATTRTSKKAAGWRVCWPAASLRDLPWQEEQNHNRPARTALPVPSIIALPPVAAMMMAVGIVMVAMVPPASLSMNPPVVIAVRIPGRITLRISLIILIITIVGRSRHSGRSQREGSCSEDGLVHCGNLRWISWSNLGSYENHPSPRHMNGLRAGYSDSVHSCKALWEGVFLPKPQVEQPCAPPIPAIHRPSRRKNWRGAGSSDLVVFLALGRGAPARGAGSKFGCYCGSSQSRRPSCWKNTRA